MNKKLIAIYPVSDRDKNDGMIINNCYIENYWGTVKKFLSNNIFEFHTFDIYQKQNIIPDICIFINVPKKLLLKKMKNDGIQIIVILREIELIEPLNFDKALHSQIDYIITYYQSFIDDKKYFKSPSTMIDFSKEVFLKDYIDRKLCTLINSNLSNNGQGELYSHRKKAIKWFEEHALQDFEFYGRGWDKYKFQGPIVVRALNKIPFLQKLFYVPYKSYKGSIDDKIKVMSQYRFSICFENANNINNYITEKIFDSFCAKCVPIYWGAPNISEVVPKECFIDFRDFLNYEELHSYIKNISDKEYMKYIEAINSFLISDKAKLFSIESFAHSIENVVNIAVEDF